MKLEKIIIIIIVLFFVAIALQLLGVLSLFAGMPVLKILATLTSL